MATPNSSPKVTIRRAKPEDAEACGRICHAAFAAISDAHNFPRELPAPEMAIGALGMIFGHPEIYCVVAEVDGKIVGSNCLDERSPVFGIGPITVAPDTQNNGVGHALMRAVMDRAKEQGAPGTRLVQAAYHSRSLSLYTKLGFVTREPLSVMSGPAIKKAVEGCSVRAATEKDLDGADEVCMHVHGHSRKGEIRDAISQASASVVEREGRITGYVTGFGYFGHAVGETNKDLQALLAATDSFNSGGGPGVLVPTRNYELFRWCLEQGMRVIQPMTLMTIGLYNEPRGAYLPSILF